MIERTWRIELPDFSPIIETTASSEEQALAIAARRWGAEATPCCELDAEPCVRCARAARQEADAEREDRHGAKERGVTP